MLVYKHQLKTPYFVHPFSKLLLNMLELNHDSVEFYVDTCLTNYEDDGLMISVLSRNGGRNRGTFKNPTIKFDEVCTNNKYFFCQYDDPSSKHSDNDDYAIIEFLIPDDSLWLCECLFDYSILEGRPIDRYMFLIERLKNSSGKKEDIETMIKIVELSISLLCEEEDINTVHVDDKKVITCDQLSLFFEDTNK